MTEKKVNRCLDPSFPLIPLVLHLFLLVARVFKAASCFLPS